MSYDTYQTDEIYPFATVALSDTTYTFTPNIGDNSCYTIKTTYRDEYISSLNISLCTMKYLEGDAD